MLILETVYLSECFKIEIDAGLVLAKTQWLRPVTDQELKESALKLRDILSAYKVDKLLVIAQGLNKLSTETKEWLSTFYYQALSATPIRKLARVKPDNLFQQLALESVTKRAEESAQLSYQMQNFLTEKEALSWLLA